MIASKIKHLSGSGESKKIFILGTGRSGTHWIGYTLGAHPEVRATVEARPAFGWSVQMALDPSQRDRLYPRIVQYYKLQHWLSAPKHYLDKSHTNIWIADRLAETFDDALFVAIKRNPYATVASMLRHVGVLEWHNTWREYPVPNPFLGIEAGAEDAYEQTPLAAQCAMRWVTHAERLDELGSLLGDKLMAIEYEDLFTNTEPVLDALSGFVGLDEPIPIPTIKAKSMDKWKRQLSDEEKEQIRGVVHLPY